MSTDPAQPEACVPPNPEVSGWWYIARAPDSCEVWEWVPDEERWILPGGHGGGDDGFHAALNGYRILGPVPTHSEVEALRAELTASNAEIARLKERIADDDHLIEDRNKQLRGLLDRQAGVANPDLDLVTVRREDLANVLAWAAENVAMKRIAIEQMEDAAR